MVDKRRKQRLNLGKSLDKETITRVAEWTTHSKTASTAEIRFQNEKSVVGQLIVYCGFARWRALLRTNPKSSQCNALIAGWLSSAHLRMCEAPSTTVPASARATQRQSRRTVCIAVSVSAALKVNLATISFTALSLARELENERTLGSRRDGEALRIWLGKRKCSAEVAMLVPFAAQTKGWKPTTLSQSRTSRSCAMTPKTENASAMTATITKSTVARQTSSMVDTPRSVKSKAKLRAHRNKSLLRIKAARGRLFISWPAIVTSGSTAGTARTPRCAGLPLPRSTCHRPPQVDS